MLVLLQVCTEVFSLYLLHLHPPHTSMQVILYRSVHPPRRYHEQRRAESKQAKRAEPAEDLLVPPVPTSSGPHAHV